MNKPRTTVRSRGSVRCIVAALALLTAGAALADNDYVLVTGRRDPRIYAIDLKAALRSENNGTDRAIVSRSLVNPRRLDGKLLGDPANIKLSADQKTAYVMNHHGAVVNAEFLQHGGRGNIAAMDVSKMLKRSLDNTSGGADREFRPGLVRRCRDHRPARPDHR